MTITSKDFSNNHYTYKIDVGAGLLIDRSFGLTTGETISFHIKLTSREGMDLRDLNRESIQRAIEILQAALPTQS